MRNIPQNAIFFACFFPGCIPGRAVTDGSSWDAWIVVSKFRYSNKLPNDTAVEVFFKNNKSDFISLRVFYLRPHAYFSVACDNRKRSFSRVLLAVNTNSNKIRRVCKQLGECLAYMAVCCEIRPMIKFKGG
jgi:hypothetical protein